MRKNLPPPPVKTLSQKLKDAGKAYVKQCIKETGDKVAKEVIAPYLTNKVKNELKSHDADKRKKTNAANAAKALDFKEKEQKKNDKEQKKNDKAGVGFV